MSSIRPWFRSSGATASSEKEANGAAPAAAVTATTTPGAAATATTGTAMSSRDIKISDIEDSMVAAGLIMNDDIDGAEAALKLREHSVFHQLGLGVSTFMRSILGLEKEIMAEASNRLAACETTAWAEMKRVQKEAGGGGWFGRGATHNVESQIYPPGSEYALVNAQAQLMGAIVSVMQESITDAIKGFYKLRKAYVTLDGIIQAEEAAMKGKPSNRTMLTRTSSTNSQIMPGSFDDAEYTNMVGGEKKDSSPEDTDVEFVDAPEERASSGTQTPASFTGQAAKGSGNSTQKDPTGETGAADLKLEPPPRAQKSSVEAETGNAETSKTPTLQASRGGSIRSTPKPPNEGSDADQLTDPVDIFVHSGANMCFGILHLMISIVPPAFSRLLYIIGFRGEQERGLRMLWQSTKFANVNGAVAGLALLSFYNGVMTFADIVATPSDIAELAEPDEVVGHPQERLDELLEKMRSHYPGSGMWQLEQARGLSNKKRLGEAIAILRTAQNSKMRQVRAINSFELALDSMYAMDWPLMRDSFVACIQLNDWSHALYYYIAGCAEVEMYRDAYHLAASLDGVEGKKEEKAQAEKDAEEHKEAATKYFKLTPTSAGKKKFMARQMPFEVYALRKVAKWEERGKALGVHIVDAVGASPAQEMVYLWNGAKRMDNEQLNGALARLDWDRLTLTQDHIATVKAAKDENAIWAVCRAAIIRSLGRLSEAKKLVEENVLKYDRTVFKGGNKDDYVLPAAHYEYAVIIWLESCDPSLYPSDANEVEEYRRKLVAECFANLDKVEKWESFILDIRVGMRVQNGLNTVKWIKEKKGWA